MLFQFQTRKRLRFYSTVSMDLSLLSYVPTKTKTLSFLHSSYLFNKIKKSYIPTKAKSFSFLYSSYLSNRIKKSYAPMKTKPFSFLYSSYPSNPTNKSYVSMKKKYFHSCPHPTGEIQKAVPIL